MARLWIFIPCLVESHWRVKSWEITWHDFYFEKCTLTAIRLQEWRQEDPRGGSVVGERGERGLDYEAAVGWWEVTGFRIYFETNKLARGLDVKGGKLGRIKDDF